MASAIRRRRPASARSVARARARPLTSPGSTKSPWTPVLQDLGQAPDPRGDDRFVEGQSRHQDATLVGSPIGQDDDRGRLKDFRDLRFRHKPQVPSNVFPDAQVPGPRLEGPDVHPGEADDVEPDRPAQFIREPGQSLDEKIQTL